MGYKLNERLCGHSSNGIQWVRKVFDKIEQVWQLKWPPMTYVALNWQLTSLARKVSDKIDGLFHLIRVATPLWVIFQWYRPPKSCLS